MLGYAGGLIAFISARPHVRWDLHQWSAAAAANFGLGIGYSSFV
jgi:hypothetical protein